MATRAACIHLRHGDGPVLFNSGSVRIEIFAIPSTNCFVKYLGGVGGYAVDVSSPRGRRPVRYKYGAYLTSKSTWGDDTNPRARLKRAKSSYGASSSHSNSDMRSTDLYAMGKVQSCFWHEFVVLPLIDVPSLRRTGLSGRRLPLRKDRFMVTLHNMYDSKSGRVHVHNRKRSVPSVAGRATALNTVTWSFSSVNTRSSWIPWADFSAYFLNHQPWLEH